MNSLKTGILLLIGFSASSLTHANESLIMKKFKNSLSDISYYNNIYQRVYGSNNKKIYKANYINLKGTNKQVFDLALKNIDNRFALCGKSIYVEPKIFNKKNEDIHPVEIYELKDANFGFIYYNNTPNIKTADKLNGITWKGMLVFTIKEGAAKKYKIDYDGQYSVSTWEDLSPSGIGGIFIGGGAIVKNNILMGDQKASEYLSYYSLNSSNYLNNKLSCERINEIINYSKKR